MNLCECGCGTPVKKRFARGHQARLPAAREKMRTAPLRYKDARTAQSAGYVTMYDGSGRHQLEHIVVAERAFGRKLPKGAEVHHVNEIRTDNRPSNLVICPSHKYHVLLHIRAKALDVCGHADWLKCHICKVYDAPKNMYIHPRGNGLHRECIKKAAL